VFLTFIGFNLENRCDISFVFYTFSQVPVYLTAFSAFVLGLLLALPLVVSFRSRRSPAEKGDEPKPSARSVSFRGRGKKKTGPDHVTPGGNGSDGID
jgi:hypothetical protein